MVTHYLLYGQPQLCAAKLGSVEESTMKSLDSNVLPMSDS